jgi:anti-sigma factor RsiW
MTDCTRTDIRDVLPDWVNGSLDEAAAAEVGEHLTMCAACGAEVELLRSMRGVMASAPEIDLHRVAAAVVQHTIPSRALAHRRRAWPVVLGGLAVAASVAIGMLLIQRTMPESGPPQPVAQIRGDDPASQTTDRPVAPDDSAEHAERSRRDSPAVRQPADAPIEPSMRLAASEVRASGGLGDLDVDELEALLRRLDAIEALPQTSPAPTVITNIEVQ